MEIIPVAMAIRSIVVKVMAMTIASAVAAVPRRLLGGTTAIGLSVKRSSLHS